MGSLDLPSGNLEAMWGYLHLLFPRLSSPVFLPLLFFYPHHCLPPLTSFPCNHPSPVSLLLWPISSVWFEYSMLEWLVVVAWPIRLFAPSTPSTLHLPLWPYHHFILDLILHFLSLLSDIYLHQGCSNPVPGTRCGQWHALMLLVGRPLYPVLGLNWLGLCPRSSLWRWEWLEQSIPLSKFRDIQLVLLWGGSQLLCSELYNAASLWITLPPPTWCPTWAALSASGSTADDSLP